MFWFTNFTFSFHGIHLKKFKLIQLTFVWRAEESLVVTGFCSWWSAIKTIECLCPGTIGLIVAFGNLMFVLKTNTLSADTFSTETLHSLISVRWLEVVYNRATFFMFFQRFGVQFWFKCKTIQSLRSL